MVADGVREGIDGVAMARDWCEGGELRVWSWFLGLEHTMGFSKDRHGRLVMRLIQESEGGEEGPAGDVSYCESVATEE
jgi:hypothetical protein